jgi:hypothetical protein
MADRPVHLSTSESSRLGWAKRAGGLEESLSPPTRQLPVTLKFAFTSVSGFTVTPR